MRSKRKRQTDDPGQDSFLDIVANLVGILIILIMIIGAHANKSMVEAATHQLSEDTSLEDDVVASARKAVVSIEQDFQRVSKQNEDLDKETEVRRRARDGVLALVAAAEQRLNERRQTLNQQQQQEFNTQNQIAAARAELEDLTDRRRSLDSDAPPVVIPHLPTPMAKTVFGKEEHFRMQGGRIAFVPFEQFVARLKDEAGNKAWKLRDAPKITETIGPIDGFRMRYTLKREQYAVPLKVGSQIRQRIVLEHLVLLPIRDDLGELFQDALDPASQFYTAIDRMDPKRTTITVWVYPDSFEEFRQLKQHLFERGFLTAGRPLPEGVPIGASPDGSHSSAQ